jgi:hypothetical protein
MVVRVIESFNLYDAKALQCFMRIIFVVLCFVLSSVIYTFVFNVIIELRISMLM